MTSKLSFSLLSATCLATLALAACHAPAVTPAQSSVSAPLGTVIDSGEGGSGTATISAMPANRQVLAYGRADIQKLRIELFRLSGTAETRVASATLLASELDRTLTFSHLRAEATYRVKATAYMGETTVISVESGSQADFSVLANGQTSFTQVPVTLAGGTLGSSSGVAPGITVAPGGTLFQGFVGSLAMGFVNPGGLDTDADGNVYVADKNGGRIAKVSPTGTITNHALSVGHPVDVTRATDGTLYFADADGRIGKVSATNQTVTTFINAPVPTGLTLGADGNLYVSSGMGVMKITPAGQTAFFAPIQMPYGLSFDAQGNLYVVGGGHSLYRVSPTGTVTTVTAQLNQPVDVEVGPDGNLYVAESTPAHRVSRVTPTGTITPLAGDGTAASTDGLGTQARVNNPGGITLDGQGRIYVAETDGNRIRKIF